MGRPLGSPNKAAGAVKELARAYGPDGIRALGEIAGFGAPGLRSDNDMTRIVAIRELLDRGYGKASQPLVGEDGKALFPRLVVLFGQDHAEPPPGITFDAEPDEISDC